MRSKAVTGSEDPVQPERLCGRGLCLGRAAVKRFLLSAFNPVGVDHHEGHEVHEERKLTTKGAKSFQSEISETFVSFMIFVVKRLFLENYLHD
jgi:hypothetical protein